MKIESTDGITVYEPQSKEDCLRALRTICAVIPEERGYVFYDECDKLLDGYNQLLIEECFEVDEEE